MKKWARILLLTLVVASLFGSMGINVLAQDTGTSDGNTSTSTDGEQTVQEDPKAPDYQAKLNERLNKNKEIAKTNVTKAQQARIKAKCKSAQGKITSVNAKIKTFKTARVEIYDKVLAKLTDLSSKLKSSGADTTELDKQILELQSLITKFKTDVTDLHQTTADLANMDCSSDPSAFKASLDIVRTKRQNLASGSSSIKTYINDTIKPTLQTLKKSLSEAESAEDN